MRDAEDCRHPDIQRAVSSVGYDIDQPAFMAEESEESKDVDGRDKPGHDAGKREGAFAPLAPCCVRDQVDAAADDRPSPLAAAIAPRYREALLRKRNRLDSVENPSLCEFIHSQTPATGAI